jgi:hypothetical protein
MSYSFQVKAASKVEAAKKVEEQFDLVVQGQPVHAADRQAAQDAAQAFINLLAEPAEGQLVAVNVQGYVSWRAEGEFTGANIGVGASIQDE